jgi:hypothetical protein
VAITIEPTVTDKPGIEPNTKNRTVPITVGVDLSLVEHDWQRSRPTLGTRSSVRLVVSLSDPPASAPRPRSPPSGGSQRLPAGSPEVAPRPLAAETGLAITVFAPPPGTSKRNENERPGLFSFIR